MPGSNLGELASSVDAVLIGDDSVRINDVTHDSRQVSSGTLFVAVRGATSDGHGFVDSAVRAGASAVCVDHAVATAIPQLVVPNTRRTMGQLAAAVHGNPSMSMKVVGVTGTNGKTTVTHYIESITTDADLTCGLIGTIETRIGGRVFPSERTTPESSDFQRLLAEMSGAGCDLVAVEVSSHALALDRVAATHFEVAAFTNLSQDHLDFHGDMTSYLEAKRTLFHDYTVGTSVINVEDPAGSELAGDIQGPLVTVGRGGAVFAEDATATAAGTSFRMVTPWGSGSIEAPVVGWFNMDNALMAAACCLASGVGFDDVVAGLASLKGVPGRFEVVSGDDPVSIVVDYAHTPEGVRLAVENARGLQPKRLIALIGAGGDRDREKRPMMGAEVSSVDLAVITSDNPRSEDPADILTAVASGVSAGTKMVLELDRRTAIRMAISAAEPGDLVLLLGRGHEPFQEIGGDRIPFDDRQVARAELARLRDSTNSSSGMGSMAL